MAAVRDLIISSRRVLPACLLSVRFSRSGGPGGQNVNKVETKVDLRLDLGGAEEILGEEPVQRLREKLANRLDGEGNLQVVSSTHRERARNLDAALSRMEALVRGALARPRQRRRTAPTRGSQERRLAEKKRRGQIKKLRQSVDD